MTALRNLTQKKKHFTEKKTFQSPKKVRTKVNLCEQRLKIAVTSVTSDTVQFLDGTSNNLVFFCSRITRALKNIKTFAILIGVLFCCILPLLVLSRLYITPSFFQLLSQRNSAVIGPQLSYIFDSPKRRDVLQRALEVAHTPPLTFFSPGTSFSACILHFSSPLFLVDHFSNRWIQRSNP